MYVRTVGVSLVSSYAPNSQCVQKYLRSQKTPVPSRGAAIQVQVDTIFKHLMARPLVLTVFTISTY